MFSNPQDNLEKLGLSPGLTVADLGSGSGHYALAAAKMVSDGAVEGKVYAVDVQKDLLDKITTEAHRQHVTNVHVIWGNIEKVGGTKLHDNSVDVAIAANVLFQVEDPKGFVQEIKRIVKPHGRLLLIDWNWNQGDVLASKTATVHKQQAIELFEKVGMQVESEISVGSHHYGLVIRKK